MPGIRDEKACLEEICAIVQADLDDGLWNPSEFVAGEIYRYYLAGDTEWG